MTTLTPTTILEPQLGEAVQHDHRAPGERYYRHPGNVIRVVAWTVVAVALVLFVDLAVATSSGVRTDLGQAATHVPDAARQLLLGVVQLGCVAVPAAVLALLAFQGRWRRAATVVGAAVAGAGMFAAVDLLLDPAPAIQGAIDADAWWIATTFPTPLYTAAVFAAVTVAQPWLSRTWGHAAVASIAALAAVVATAGSAGVPELAIAVAIGGLAGSLVLLAFGAPNRRPSPAAIAAALGAAGIDVTQLDLRRAVGGRSQLYRATTPEGGLFLKVYSDDSRDADLLYRSYRTLVLRDSDDGWPPPALARDVEHEAFLMMLASRHGVACPALRTVAALPDGSMVLAMQDLGGRRLDELAADDLGGNVLDDLWRQVHALHRAGLAHRSLRAANVLVTEGRPVLIDFGAAGSAASARMQAIDRAELLASLAAAFGVDTAVSSAARVLDQDELAAAMPYLQPLALSTATRRGIPGAMLRDLRTRVAEVTARDVAPLERLIRVRPRTIFMIATLTGAFYILLPQLASVDDSVEALRSANWLWLAGAVVMSALTYVASAVGSAAATRHRLPLGPTTQVALASSFVNRVTPANVGGMALNVRYMQKAGVPPAEAVTGVGLNVLAGGVIHAALLAVFLSLAGRQAGSAFHIPSSSKVLVAVAVVLALVGIALATRRGRKVAKSKVVPALRQSFASIAAISRAPGRLSLLLASSAVVTLAYTSALAFAIAAFDGGISFVQVGAVYLGASLIAAAAPTPGGLGAIEAALVAGLTGVGMDPAIAVAAVLSYRLVTYWLPVLPGWLCFRVLERRNYI
jgi:glycosyltransferase 2 family protein